MGYTLNKSKYNPRSLKNRGTNWSIRCRTDQEIRELNAIKLRNDFQFVRWFISTLINLQYCGRNGLEISGESNNFFWIGQNQPWQGWMNVYSMNKAGKGVQHRPVINPNGTFCFINHPFLFFFYFFPFLIELSNYPCYFDPFE